MNEKLKNTIKQFLKFAMIGVFNTLVDLAVLNAETIISGVTEGSGYAIQKGLSFMVAVTVSYFLNKHWAFQDKSKKEEGKKFSQFLFVSIMGMLINVTVATVTVTYLKEPVQDLINISLLQGDQIWVSIGALAGTAIGLIWNFVGYKIWVFKK
jgi:putative flippase GtrA